MRLYEPDFIVCGLDVTKEDIPSTPCEVINLTDITDNINDEGRPGYGVGLIEVLKGYYDKEYKFLRRYKLTHYLPAFGNKNGRFLRTVFGDLPNELDTKIKENIQESLEADFIKITPENYFSYLAIGSPCDVHWYNSYQIKIDFTGNEKGSVLVFKYFAFYILTLLHLKFSFIKKFTELTVSILILFKLQIFFKRCSAVNSVGVFTFQLFITF